MTPGEKERSPQALGDTLTAPQGTGKRPEGGLLPVEPGRYEVERELARGGLGRILAAHDRRLGRTVALKESLARDDLRLVREALITARLQHPSIVPVHDAGRWSDGEPFFAMTRLAGRSLREVIEERRTMRERLALLPSVIAVADAVAYAHSQGIIHRDLKPANVIIGDFGETVVIDWGLARSVRDGDEEPAAPAAGRGGLPAGETRTGEILGTPAYMAPEQARGEAADERADVYALGGILYHVLTGAPPGSGQVAPLLSRAPDAPAELAAIAGKALAADKARRYPSAAELAEDLKRFQTGKLVAAHRYSLPALAWRWLRRRALPVAALAGVVSVVAGVGLTWRWQERRRPAVCRGFERALAGVWDGARRAELQAAFARSGSPAAEPAFAAVAAALDAHAARWIDRRRDACEATHVRGEQSAAALDLRMRCFDERRGELAALVSVLGASDAAGVARAAQLAGSLTPLQRCDDVAALAALVPPPADRIAAARVGALLGQLATGRFLARAGHVREAQPIAEAIAAEAETLGYRPLEAEARRVLGAVRWSAGDAAGGERETRRAVLAAEAGRNDGLRADSLITLLFIHGEQARFALAHDEADWTGAIIERLGGRDDLRISLYESEATVYRDEHRLPEARALLEKALALLDAQEPRNDYQTVTVLLNLMNVLNEMPLADAAIAAGERALAVVDRLPAGHAGRGLLLTSLGWAYRNKGDTARAAALYRKSIEVISAQLGPSHRDLGYDYFNLGELEHDAGDDAAAVEDYQRARAIFEAAFGVDHPSLVQTLGGLALALLGAGRRAEALATFERAAKLLRPGDAPSPFLLPLARGLWDAGGDRDQAVGLARQARGPDAEAWLARACATRPRPKTCADSR